MRTTHNRATARHSGDNIAIDFDRPVNSRVNCAHTVISHKEARNLIGRIMDALEQRAANETLSTYIAAELERKHQIPTTTKQGDN